MFEIRAFSCPVQLLCDGRLVRLRSQERVILLRMLCAKDLTVPGTVLVNALWHGGPTDAAAATLRSHLSKVRCKVRRLAGESMADSLFGTSLVARRAIYRLAVDPDRIDVRRWEKQLLAACDRLYWEPSRDTESELVGALAGWTADPFAEALGWQFARDERLRLDRLRLNGRLQLADLRIQTERYRDVVAELEDLVAAYPGELGIWQRLVTSLWRSQQDDAAARACKHAVEAFRELGLDLTELQALQHAVLHGTLPR